MSAPTRVSARSVGLSSTSSDDLIASPTHDAAGFVDTAAADPLVPRQSTPHLVQRVPGTQMPTTTPIMVRLVEPGSVPAETPLSRPAGPRRSADAVYEFLTNFSAGVQRGLEATRQNRRPES
jgi:hypothetical protein